MNQLRHQLHRRRQSSISRASLKVRKMIRGTDTTDSFFIDGRFQKMKIEKILHPSPRESCNRLIMSGL